MNLSKLFVTVSAYEFLFKDAFLIAPFMHWFLTSVHVYVLFHFQVDDVFTASLETIADSNNIAYTRFHDNFGRYTTPVFLRQSYKIWGLTSVVLHEALRAIIPEVYKVNFVKYPVT